jgi:hypothetical protein
MIIVVLLLSLVVILILTFDKINIDVITISASLLILTSILYTKSNYQEHFAIGNDITDKDVLKAKFLKPLKN